MSEQWRGFVRFGGGKVLVLINPLRFRWKALLTFVERSIALGSLVGFLTRSCMPSWVDSEGLAMSGGD